MVHQLVTPGCHGPSRAAPALQQISGKVASWALKIPGVWLCEQDLFLTDVPVCSAASVQ